MKTNSEPSNDVQEFSDKVRNYVELAEKFKGPDLEHFIEGFFLVMNEAQKEVGDLEGMEFVVSVIPKDSGLLCTYAAVQKEKWLASEKELADIAEKSGGLYFTYHEIIKMVTIH